MDSHDVAEAAKDANESPVMQGAARLGYAVNGLVHLLVGWLAVQLAWFSSGGPADQSGALATMAGTSLGRALLWVVVAGFAGLGLWQLTEAAVGRFGPDATTDRLKAVAKGVLYLVLCWTTLGFARSQTGSGGTKSRKDTQDITATLMEQTAGRFLVGILGLVVVGVGAYHVVKGAKRTFLQDLEQHPGTWAENAGRYGYVAKGVALGIVGMLFVVAAWTQRPAEATGLDGALREVLKQPYGQIMLTLVALGFVAFGVYSFARARHAKL